MFRPVTVCAVSCHIRNPDRMPEPPPRKNPSHAGAEITHPRRLTRRFTFRIFHHARDSGGSKMRRRGEAAEFVLDETGKGQRRAVVEVAADDLHANRQPPGVMANRDGRRR